MKKFVKVLEPPDFTFWHFEIVYKKDDKKEGVK
jgi:hypothetical protein